MDKEIILSILIPTYNRRSFLETTVETFISQITEGQFEDVVEIVIGDDASSDTTEDYLKKLTAMYPYIRSYTNSPNMGVSANIEKLVDTAMADMIWLFGEDDLIKPSTLKVAIERILTNEPNVILFNTVNMLSTDDKNLNYTVVGDKRLRIDRDEYFEVYEKEKERLIAIKGWLYLTNLISPVIFRKRFFSAYMLEVKKYLRPENVYLWQAPLIIGMVQEGRIMMIADVMVLHRKNENHWSKNIQGKLTVSLYDGGVNCRMIKKYMPIEFKEYQKRFAAHTFGIISNAVRDRIRVKKYIWDAFLQFYDCYPYNLRFLIMMLYQGVFLKVGDKL